jgi:flagellin
LLTSIANASTTTAQRAQYITQYQGLVSQVANAVDSSTYNGQTLLGNTGQGVAGASFDVVTDENGNETDVAAQNEDTIANTFASFIGQTLTRTEALGVVTDTFGATGTEEATASTSLATVAEGGTAIFATSQAAVNTSLNQVGADNTLINATITFNNAKIDSLNTGLGSLIDADLTAESAVLQSLQIKQQLGTQALTIANQTPQTLLSLFK